MSRRCHPPEPSGCLPLSVNGMAVRSIEEYAKLLDLAPMGKARLEILDARSMKVIVKDVQLDPLR